MRFASTGSASGSASPRAASIGTSPICAAYRTALVEAWGSLQDQDRQRFENMPDVEPRERLRSMMQAVVQPAAVGARAGHARVGADRRSRGGERAEKRRPGAARGLPGLRRRRIRTRGGRRQIGRLLRGGDGRAARLGSATTRLPSCGSASSTSCSGPNPTACRPGLRVEVLQQIVGGQLDVLVPPFRSSVDAGDQAGAVNPAQVAVDERVSRLGVVLWRLRSGRGATPRTRPTSGSPGRRSARRRAAALLPSRCPARTAARRSACAPWSPRPCSAGTWPCHRLPVAHVPATRRSASIPRYPAGRCPSSGTRRQRQSGNPPWDASNTPGVVNMKLIVARNSMIASRLPNSETLGHHGLTASSAAAASSNTPSRAEKV